MKVIALEPRELAWTAADLLPLPQQRFLGNMGSASSQQLGSVWGALPEPHGGVCSGWRGRSFNIRPGLSPACKSSSSGPGENHMALPTQ